MTTCGRVARRNFRPIFYNPQSKLFAFKSIYNFLGVACSITLMNYFFIPFMTREFNASISIWMRTYFFAHVVTACVILAFDYAKLGPKLQSLFMDPVQKTE